MKFITRALATVAIASFAVAQPASAATRSADSLPQSGVTNAAVVDRAAAPVAESEELFGAPFVAILLVFGALVAALAAAGAFGGGKDSTG